MFGKADDTSRENILIIGDSISIGYTPTVQKSLPEYEVVHNFCNAQSSANGVSKVNAWVGQRSHFKVITFNHGIWDHTEGWSTTKSEYLHNLESIARELQLHADRVVFFTTTEIPVNVLNMKSGDVDDWNTDAVLLMNSLGVAVYDLNAVSKTIPQFHINAAAKTDVHFIPEGYEILGNFVSNSIRTELGGI